MSRKHDEMIGVAPSINVQRCPSSLWLVPRTWPTEPSRDGTVDCTSFWKTSMRQPTQQCSILSNAGPVHSRTEPYLE